MANVSDRTVAFLDMQQDGISLAVTATVLGGRL